MNGRSGTIRSLLAVGGLPVLLGLLGVALARPARPTGEREIFAGPARCEECHPDVHEAWGSSTHANTLTRATRQSLPRVMAEGGRILHPPGESRFFAAGDSVEVETTGPSGEPERYPVLEVLGARRVRMYLTRLPNGRRQVLPFMLDEPNGRYFDYTDLIFGAGGADPLRAPVVRPGEPSFWTGATRFFDAACARCHTTGWRFLEPADVEEGGVRSRWEIAGVTCESCHGAAGEHVAYWDDEAPEEVVEDPITVLGGLDDRRRNDVCLSCHTEADPVEPGFSAGDDFLEKFDPTLPDDSERLDPAGRPLELVYDGVPFLMSACAREGGLTCMTCHDPHESPYRGQVIAPPKSAELCADCHEEIVSAGRNHSRHDPNDRGGSCVACHMPLVTVERGHGVVTDHTIGVPNPGFYGPRIAEDACTGCHTGSRGAPGGVPRILPEKIRRAYAEWWPEAAARSGDAALFDRARRGDGSVVDELGALAADRSALRAVRATAAALLGRFPDAAGPHLVRLATDDDSLVRRRVATSFAAITTEEADSVLLRLLLDDSPAVRRRAAEAALAGWDRVRRTPSLLEPVLRALEERTEWFPEDDRGWFLLGAARQIAGDRAGAVEAYERKLDLDPYASAVRRAVERLRGR